MSASKIVKEWQTGDQFLASDQETINKGTINDIIDDNTASHLLTVGTGANTITTSANTAAGQYAVAFGNATESNGTGSFSMGFGAEVSGNYSATFGYDTSVSGSYAYAFGHDHILSANYTFATGQDHTVNSGYSAIIGGSGLTENEENMVQVPRLRIKEIETDNTQFHILAIDSNNKILRRSLSAFGDTVSYTQTTASTALSNGSYSTLKSYTIPSGSNKGVYKIDFDIQYNTRYADTMLCVKLQVDSVDKYETMSYPVDGGTSYLSNINGIFYYSLIDNSSAITITIQTKADDNVDDYTIKGYNSSATLYEII